GRVACLLHVFGDHAGDRITDIAHLVLRHGRMRRLLHRLPVLTLDAPTAGQPVDAVGLEIGASEYGKHARHDARSARVDGLDFRMCVRRAHENAGDHCGPLDIGDVIAPPGQEAKILLSARGSANPDHFGHGSVSPDGGACTCGQQMLPSSQCIVNCPKHRWSLSDRFSGGCGAAPIDFKSLACSRKSTLRRRMTARLEALYAVWYSAIAITARVSVLLGCRSSSRIVK